MHILVNREKIREREREREYKDKGSKPIVNLKANASVFLFACEDLGGTKRGIWIRKNGLQLAHDVGK